MICSECPSKNEAVTQCPSDDAFLCQECVDKGCPLCVLREKVHGAIRDAGGDPDTAYVIRHEVGNMDGVAEEQEIKYVRSDPVDHP